MKEDEDTPPVGLQEMPFATVIGAFQDDPMLDAMMGNIRERRREIDADDSIH